jgi:hypothetical protein
LVLRVRAASFGIVDVFSFVLAILCGSIRYCDRLWHFLSVALQLANKSLVVSDFFSFPTSPVSLHQLSQRTSVKIVGQLINPLLRTQVFLRRF